MTLVVLHVGTPCTESLIYGSLALYFMKYSILNANFSEVQLLCDLNVEPKLLNPGGMRNHKQKLARIANAMLLCCFKSDNLRAARSKILKN